MAGTASPVRAEDGKGTVGLPAHDLLPPTDQAKKRVVHLKHGGRYSNLVLWISGIVSRPRGRRRLSGPGRANSPMCADRTRHKETHAAYPVGGRGGSPRRSTKTAHAFSRAGSPRKTPGPGQIYLPQAGVGAGSPKPKMADRVARLVIPRRFGQSTFRVQMIPSRGA